MLDVVLTPARPLERRDRRARAGSRSARAARPRTTARWLARLGRALDARLRGRTRPDRAGPWSTALEPRRRHGPATRVAGPADGPDRGAGRAGRRALVRGRPGGRRPAPPADLDRLVAGWTCSTCRPTRCSASRSGMAGRRAIELARAAGALVSLDLASAGRSWRDGRRAALRLVSEAAPGRPVRDAAARREALLGGRDLDGLLELAPVVVIKRGARGATVLARPGEPGAACTFEVATRPLCAPDTTGAGDAFDAGFLVAWLTAEPARGTARRAAASGAGRPSRGRAPAHGPAAGADAVIGFDRLRGRPPEVAAALAAGAPGRGARVDADQPRPAVPAEPGGRPRVRGGGARDAARSRRRSRSATGGSSSAWTRRRSRRLRRHRPGSVRKAARPSLAAGARRRRLGRDDRVGHDDRGPCGGHPGIRHRRHRRRPPGRARRRRARRSTSRRTSRSSAGRRWRSSAPAPRRSSTCRRRSSTSRRAACRSSPSARPSCPGSTRGRPGSRRRRRSPDVAGAAAIAAVHLGLGLGAACSCASRCPAAEALPEDVARDADRPGDRGGRSGRHRAGRRPTPWLLARIAELTDGASVRANTALIVNDARVAGQLASRSPGPAPQAEVDHRSR